jgi:type II secretory pathway predicted ATPase ExeA
MYLEHFHLTSSPFAEEPDPEIFFPGARREEICQSLILDILAGKQLLKLIGREGSGKTLICQLIADRLPETYHVVFLDNPLGSFEELLRMLGVDGRGGELKGGQEQPDLYGELQNLLVQHRANGLRIVLVIDEAEKLFLATLERLVRHVGDGPDDLHLTLVLAGRPGLDANLEQLATLGTNVAIDAGYLLEDLTESEIRQYLRYRVSAAGMRREQFAEVFTEGAVAKIFDAAKGNLRLINILAEETLQAFCAEKSFMVLLDHVDPEPVDSPAWEHRQWEDWILDTYDLLRSNRLVAGTCIGVILVLVVIGVFLSGGGKPSHPTTEVSPPPSSLTPGQETADRTNQGMADDSAPSGPREIRDGDKLYRERLAASASWLAGIYKGGFTIQLMMLVSNQAQSSIAETLTQDAYYEIRDQLYILRKKGNPATLFVFYGMYDSLEAAREARNGMPVFLRKHHPYPLAISEAVKKIEN